jgi:PAS domain S-box-containing protein
MLLQSIPVPIFYKDKDGKYLGFNQAFEAFFGSKKEELVGKTVYEINPPELAEEYSRRDNELFEKPGLQVYESKVKNARGEIRNVIFSKGTLLDIKGNITGLIGVVQDITERKLAEDKVEKLLGEKELILKEVHHRIKNNMNNIASLLLIQSEAMQNREMKDILSDAAGRVHSMMVLYDRLYQSLHFQELPLKNYIPWLISEILQNFPDGGKVKVRYTLGDVILEVKKLQPLGIIINELITNIMKHAFSGIDDRGISVSASLDGGLVRVVVQDNGKGMPEGFNAEKSRGFGMKLVGMLAEQLGGRLLIERDGGTRFVLEFEV